MGEQVHYTALHGTNEQLAPSPGATARWTLMRYAKHKVVDPDTGARVYGWELAPRLAYRWLVPLREQLTVERGRSRKTVAPAIAGLLFLCDTRERLESIVTHTHTHSYGLEFRYLRGNAYREPVTVPDADIDAFLTALHTADDLHFYAAADAALQRHLGHPVRLPLGDTLVEGELVSIRGSRYRRLRLRLANTLVADFRLPPDTPLLLPRR